MFAILQLLNIPNFVEIGAFFTLTANWVNCPNYHLINHQQLWSYKIKYTWSDKPYTIIWNISKVKFTKVDICNQKLSRYLITLINAPITGCVWKIWEIIVAVVFAILQMLSIPNFVEIWAFFTLTANWVNCPNYHLINHQQLWSYK